MFPFEARLAQIIIAIDKQIPLKEEEQVLIMYKLRKPEWVDQFAQWVESKLNELDEIQSTKEEILRAAVQISKQ